MSRTAALAAECLAQQPAFSIRHFMKREPFLQSGDAEWLAESMRLAGLPE